MPSELLENLRKECGAAIADDLNELLKSGREDIIPEARRIANTMLRLGKAMANPDKNTEVIWESLKRQLQGLHAICYRRGWESALQVVGRVAGIALGILLKRMGV